MREFVNMPRPIICQSHPPQARSFQIDTQSLNAMYVLYNIDTQVRQKVDQVGVTSGMYLWVYNIYVTPEPISSICDRWQSFHYTILSQTFDKLKS